MKLTLLGKLLENIIYLVAYTLYIIYTTIEVVSLSALLVPLWILSCLVVKRKLIDLHRLADDIMSFSGYMGSEERFCYAAISIILYVVLPINLFT